MMPLAWRVMPLHWRIRCFLLSFLAVGQVFLVTLHIGLLLDLRRPPAARPAAVFTRYCAKPTWQAGPEFVTCSVLDGDRTWPL